MAHICWILLWAKIARQKHTIAPSYEQNTAKLGEIHGTVNLGFKRPVHEGYNMWRTTFQLDTVMGMGPCNTDARRVTATVPVETLLGCVPEKLWVFTSPEPCRCLWLVQPDDHIRLLQQLQHRVHHHRDKNTSVIIACPDMHPIAVALEQWHAANAGSCTLLAVGNIPTQPFLGAHGEHRQTYTPLPCHVYWVTGRHEHNVSLNDIVANVGMHARRAGLQFHEPLQSKCTAHPHYEVKAQSVSQVKTR